MKTLTVNTVIDLVDPVGHGAHGSDKPTFQVPAHGNEMIYERADRFPQQVIFTILSVQVKYVPAVLPMNAYARPGNRRDDLALHRAKISSVHDIGFQTSECFEEVKINSKIVPLAFVQSNDFYILSHNSATEIRITLQANNSVAITVRGNVI